MMGKNQTVRVSIREEKQMLQDSSGSSDEEDLKQFPRRISIPKTMSYISPREVAKSPKRKKLPENVQMENRFRLQAEKEAKKQERLNKKQENIFLNRKQKAAILFTEKFLRENLKREGHAIDENMSAMEAVKLLKASKFNFQRSSSELYLLESQQSEENLYKIDGITTSQKANTSSQPQTQRDKTNDLDIQSSQTPKINTMNAIKTQQNFRRQHYRSASDVQSNLNKFATTQTQIKKLPKVSLEKLAINKLTQGQNNNTSSPRVDSLLLSPDQKAYVSKYMKSSDRGNEKDRGVSSTSRMHRDVSDEYKHQQLQQKIIKLADSTKELQNFNPLHFSSAMMGIDKKDQTFVRNSYKIYGMDNLNNKKIMKLLSKKGHIQTVVNNQRQNFLKEQKQVKQKNDSMINDLGQKGDLQQGHEQPSPIIQSRIKDMMEVQNQQTGKDLMSQNSIYKYSALSDQHEFVPPNYSGLNIKFDQLVSHQNISEEQSDQTSDMISRLDSQPSLRYNTDRDSQKNFTKMSFFSPKQNAMTNKISSPQILNLPQAEPTRQRRGNIFIQNFNPIQSEKQVIDNAIGLIMKHKTNSEKEQLLTSKKHARTQSLCDSNSSLQQLQIEKLYISPQIKSTKQQQYNNGNSRTDSLPHISTSIDFNGKLQDINKMCLQEQKISNTILKKVKSKKKVFRKSYKSINNKLSQFNH